MLKLSLASFVVVSFTLSPAVVGAEPSRPLATGWYFRAEYSNGQYPESTDPTVSGPILMYTGTNWRCQRVATTLSKKGILMGGYSCTSASGFVGVMATCSNAVEMSDVAQAGVGDTNGHVTLSAKCATKSAGTPTSNTKSFDREL